MKRSRFFMAFLLSTCFCYSTSYSQNVEVQGKLVVTDVDNDDSADSIIVRLSDGSFGYRNASTLTEYQVLTIGHDTLFLTNGGFVVLPPEVDGDSINEIQELAYNGDTIFLSESNYIVIPGLGNVALIPTCEDTTMNGNETGVDCGGPNCQSCVERCQDGIQNGDETGIDCGGTSCDPCPTCSDGIQNGDEEGIDCGGTQCDSCGGIDIILVVDNSGDMAGEMASIQSVINLELLENLTMDWRLILISDYGDICIPPPIFVCGGPTPLNSSNGFFYSTQVNSQDALCKIIDGYDTPDVFNLAPTGWQEYLRENTTKVFMVFTTDRVLCSTGSYALNDSNTVSGGQHVAAVMDTALIALAPEHFGTYDTPNYIFYSIVNIAENGAAGVPYPPTDPVVLSSCEGSPVGTGYQVLSINTEGQRYSVCDESSYDVVFNNIASSLNAMY